MVHATASPMLRDPVADARIWVGSRARTMPITGMVQTGRPETGKIAAFREHAANAMPGKVSRRSGNQAGCGFSIITPRSAYRQPSHCGGVRHAMTVINFTQSHRQFTWGITRAATLWL